MSPSSPIVYFESPPLVPLVREEVRAVPDGDLLHPATRRGRVLVEHRIHDGLEVGVHDGLATAVDVAVLEQERADLVEGGLDLGVGERDLVADPVVGDLRILGLEEDFLDPVRQLPARRRAGAAGADAERMAAVGDDLVGEGDELVPGLGNRVALGREGLDRVPDHRLDVGLGRDAPDVVALAGEADGRREFSLELRGAIGAHDRGDVLDLALLGVREHAGRLRQRRHVRRAAALDPGLEHGLVARADAVDLDRDAGRRREVLDRRGEAFALAAGPLRLDRDLLAVERLVGAECLVQLGVAGRDRRQIERRRCRRGCGRCGCGRCAMRPARMRPVRMRPARMRSATCCCSRMR